jgi:hypothetical protein
MAERVQMMHRVRTVGAVVLLASCVGACGGVEDDSDLLKMGGLLVQQTGLFGGANDSVTREKAASVPYASIGMRLGSSQEAMLLLATSQGENLRWQAGTQYVINTRDGHVTFTTGFKHNLDGLQGPIADSTSTPPDRGGPYHYLFDMVDMGKYGVFAVCSQHDVGAEQIEIIGIPHDTRHIVENCKAKQLRWRFSNDYWRDAVTGYVWKSVQNFRPDMDPLTLEILRPEK